MKWYRDRQPPFGNQIEMGDLPAYKDCMGNWRDKETNELLETKAFEEAFKDDSVNIEMSKVRYKSSWASYRDKRDKKLIKCDLDELAKILTENWGNIPKYISDAKAMELHLLAKAYLKYRDKDKMKTKRLK